jgi:hypothetical protein
VKSTTGDVVRTSTSLTRPAWLRLHQKCMGRPLTIGPSRWKARHSCRGGAPEGLPPTRRTRRDLP